MRSRIFSWGAAFVLLCGFAGTAVAQPVLLEIRPRVGDTLAIRMDQHVEMFGLTRGDTTKSLVMETSIFTRAVPLRASRTSTVVLGVADSVVMTPKTPAGGVTTRQLAGRSTKMRIDADGGVTPVDNDASSRDLADVFGQMPALLPRSAVAVGRKWTREMPVPLTGDSHAQGWVRATFVLDSLSRNGDIAFVSLRGVLSHERQNAATEPSEAAGTIAGTLQLNRRLGWITDSFVTIVLESLVASRDKTATSSPMRVRTRIVQKLKAVAR